MEFDVQIDQKQLAELIKKADPAHIKEDMKGLMKDAGHHGRTVAQHNLRGGTDQAAISMRFDAQPMSAKVYSVMPPARAMSIEEGRQPGELPPLLQIARWVTGRRYMTQRRLHELSTAEREQIESVRETIRARGTSPKHFIEGARAAILRDMPDMLSKVARKIESRFKR